MGTIAGPGDQLYPHCVKVEVVFWQRCNVIVAEKGICGLALLDNMLEGKLRSVSERTTFVPTSSLHSAIAVMY